MKRYNIYHFSINQNAYNETFGGLSEIDLEREGWKKRFSEMRNFKKQIDVNVPFYKVIEVNSKLEEIPGTETYFCNL